MTERPQDRARGPRFVRRAAFDQADLVGARWWREGVETAADPVSRRKALLMLAGLGAVVAGAGGAFAWITSSSRRSAAAGVTERGRLASLEVQSAEGWDTGAAGKSLQWPGAIDVDVDGTSNWRHSLATLATELEPKQALFKPHYVSTSFSSLGVEANSGLRDAVRPMHTPAMEEAFQKGRALRSLFEGVPADTAVVADLPGEESVAFAAALADRFQPVFLFDNWPHPAGVVPSHLPIAAALYYLPAFARADATRAADAAPLFAIDDRRLAPYVDEPSRFDNRYLAKLPNAKALAALGVRHVLYVKKSASPLAELDDLNDDFVALRAANVDVKILPLTDFSRASAQAASSPTSSPASLPAGAPRNDSGYWYGGHPHSHFWFWPMYGWHPWPYRPLAPRPPAVSSGSGFTPTPRSTLFSRGRPSGFGTTPHVVRNTTSGGGTSGRSGSFGRSSSGFGG